MKIKIVTELLEIEIFYAFLNEIKEINYSLLLYEVISIFKTGYILKCHNALALVSISHAPLTL